MFEETGDNPDREMTLKFYEEYLPHKEWVALGNIHGENVAIRVDGNSRLQPSIGHHRWVCRVNTHELTAVLLWEVPHGYSPAD